MYRDLELHCPACTGALGKVPSALPALGCVGCGGMWLGPDATVHVMRGLDDALGDEVASAARELATHAPSAAMKDDGRTCPQCTQPLARLLVEKIALDSCFTHGTFFDAREVLAVLRTCTELRDEHEHEGEIVSVARMRILWRAFARFLNG